jgi:hypothetical protein
MVKIVLADIKSLTQVVKRPTLNVSISRYQGIVVYQGNLLQGVQGNRHHLDEDPTDRSSFLCPFCLLNHLQQR